MKKDLVNKKQASTKSKLQVKYEKLLKDIEQQKLLQKNLEEGIKIIMPRIENEMSPLIDQKNNLVRERLIRLDELATELGVGKFNKDWFEPYMANQASGLLEVRGYEDEVLKGIFEKYSEEPLLPDEELLEDFALQFESEFGIEVDIDELMKKGIDTYLRENRDHLQQKMAEKREAQEAEDLNNYHNSPKKKVSKQDQQLMQDAKAIYLRLMKKYHPDRGLDEAAKSQYTEISQKVTTAYKNNDFLSLLQLQIEYIEEQETDASFLAEDMLKRYNKVLQKQLNEIREEIYFMKDNSMGLFDAFFDKNHKFSLRMFNRHKKELQTEIESMQEEIKASYKRKKGWFKESIKEIKEYQQELMIQESLMQFYTFRG